MTITEREILNARKRANGYSSAKDKTLLEIPDGGFNLTPEQTKKGLNYLLDLAFLPSKMSELRKVYREDSNTPEEYLRKNCPFGEREIYCLLNFKIFLLTDWYDAISSVGFQMGYHNYCPVYTVISKDGTCFDYYFNGSINIIG